MDAGIAIAAFLFGCMQLVLVTSSFIMPDENLRHLLGIDAIVPSTAAYVAVVLTVFPVMLRRRFPWPVFVFTLVLFVLFQSSFRGYSLTIVGPFIALCTITSERSRGEAIAAGVLALVGLTLAGAPTQSVTLTFLTRFQNMAFMAAGAFGGYAFKTHREYVRATEQRAIEAERTREEEAARRVEEERVRIAREVHDITAHSLSAVSIQAAAAERLIERDPKAAKDAIVLARHTAKDALEEIRGMIGVLRQGDAAADAEPTAGTDRLIDLAAYLEGAGVKTQLDVSRYDRASVPVYVDVAVFGIAREAATNIVRHARARSASIRLTLLEDGVQLVVEDDGCATTGGAQGNSGGGRTPASHGGGHGIQGMAERARLLGGTLEAGARANGGFRVDVYLPLSQGKRADCGESR